MYFFNLSPYLVNTLGAPSNDQINHACAVVDLKIDSRPPNIRKKGRVSTCTAEQEHTFEVLKPFQYQPNLCLSK